MNLPISRNSWIDGDAKTFWPLHGGYSSAFNQSLAQNNQECANYDKNAKLFLIRNDEENRTILMVYDTESKIEETIVLNNRKLLSWSTCITQLPNGELFCYGTNPHWGTTVMIDKKHCVKILPSGLPCSSSSSIYFNGSIYCFGGQMYMNRCLCMRFDLDKNRWMKATPMPIDDCRCHSIIFKGKILISGYEMGYLLIYSIEIDSFSIIPHRFAHHKRKILVNAKKLYLIECDGLIHEGEDEYHWKKISYSIIENTQPAQVYALYNKDAIYISNSMIPRYYKFDLSTKIMSILQ